MSCKCKKQAGDYNMKNPLVITVCKNGNVRVFQNGVEIKHLQKVSFLAGTDSVPKLILEQVII